MNQTNLKRIQATLSQLNDLSSEQPLDSAFEDQTLQKVSPLLSVPVIAPETVRPFSTSTEATPPLTLPHTKSNTDKQPRQVFQPGLSLGILKEIEKILSNWHGELQQLTLTIQDLQLEGPIIDGWLESQLDTPINAEQSFLQHAEISQISQYVNYMEDWSYPSSTNHSRTIYRLCTLDTDGHIQSQACPPDQVSQVSLAIARHQKLRQLLSRKHYLESRLSQLAENLVTIHSYLQEPDPNTSPKEASEATNLPGVG